ncbi:MAG TPA: hypothetical protein VFV63_05135 [Ilumatobacteraceae bacterium]|nr:hypothetical protein [Ilumatobacteraceae bacterium]
MIATIDSDGYRIVMMLHILSAVVAFGPIFLYPTLHRAGQSATIAKLHLRMSLPALGLLWVLGMALSGMSDDVYKVSQTWLVLSIVNWVILIAVSWFLIRPSLTDASESARSKLAMGSGITHLLLVFGLYLMIFKPGL